KAVRRRGGQPRPAPMQGRPPTTRPWPRPHKREKPAAARASPHGAAAAGNATLTTGPAVGHPQGTVARGQPCHQQGLQCRPQGWWPLSRAAVGGQGQPSPA
ncbi:hypothetical protein GW17_00060720, partial [Ensete ventricosum]